MSEDIIIPIDYSVDVWSKRQNVRREKRRQLARHKQNRYAENAANRKNRPNKRMPLPNGGDDYEEWENS